MLEASALVEYVLGTDLGVQVGSIVEEPDTPLHVPVSCDVDFCAGLRGLDRAVGFDVLAIYANLPLIRHETHTALALIHRLTDRFSAYHAPYIALAEHLDATFVTCDARLTRDIRERTALNVVGVT